MYIKVMHKLGGGGGGWWWLQGSIKPLYQALTCGRWTSKDHAVTEMPEFVTSSWCRRGV